MKKIVELKKEDFFNKGLDNPLRKPSEIIVDFDEQLNALLLNMKEVFDSFNISVGLSAPQIGINKQVIIVNLNKIENKEDLIIINPKIISNTGKIKESYESCLSIPKHKGKVKRKDKLLIEYYDKLGNKNKLETKGFLGRVILHEIDHLKGILFVDHIDSESNLEEVDFEWE